MHISEPMWRRPSNGCPRARRVTCVVGVAAQVALVLIVTRQAGSQEAQWLPGQSFVDGERVLAISALDLQARHRLTKATVVTTVMANLGFRTAMQAAGIQVVETPVGMVDEFSKAAQEVWKELAGKVYSKEDLDMVLKYRDEFRAKKGPAKK